MRIILARHGELLGNQNPTLLTALPDHTIDLSKTGAEQAIAAGNFLSNYLADCKPSDRRPRCWVSPYARTRQTFQNIAGNRPLFCDSREDIRLCEQQFGLFDGIPDNELENKFPNEYQHYKKAQDFQGRFWARMPLGELRFDVCNRVHQFFGTIQRDKDRHGIDTVVIVSHGVTIRAFVMMWCHKSWEWFENEPNPKNCSIRLLEGYEDKGYIYEGTTSEPERSDVI